MPQKQWDVSQESYDRLVAMQQKLGVANLGQTLSYCGRVGEWFLETVLPTDTVEVFRGGQTVRSIDGIYLVTVEPIPQQKDTLTPLAYGSGGEKQRLAFDLPDEGLRRFEAMQTKLGVPNLAGVVRYIAKVGEWCLNNFQPGDVLWVRRGGKVVEDIPGGVLLRP